jgi:hypothetical protein
MQARQGSNFSHLPMLTGALGMGSDNSYLKQYLCCVTRIKVDSLQKLEV